MRLSLKVNQLSWALLSSSADSYGILPRRFLNKPKFVLLKSRFVILFVCFTFFRILNFTVSGSLQLSPPLTFTSLASSSVFVNNRSAEHLPLLANWSPVSGNCLQHTTGISWFACTLLCYVALPVDTKVVKIFHDFISHETSLSCQTSSTSSFWSCNL